MAKSVFDKEKELFIPVYKRLPLNISRGEGVHLYDIYGNRYLDFFSGLAVNALGYSHPRIVDAVCSQISKFSHLSNNFITDIQVEFSELLLKHSRMSKLFLTNSGTESIEGAIKIVRKKYGQDKTIFSLTNGFHGRTYGSLSLTSKEKYRNGFEPFLPNTGKINFNDIDDLQLKINEETAAIFIEFIQGEGGINIVSEDFTARLIELKNKFNFLIIADSIQCGIGRTGRPFSHNYYEVQPDIIVTAKAIGGGLPLGAMLISDELKDILKTGVHGTTFGGNPVSCAAGKVVLEEVFERGLVDEVKKNGEYFISQLKEIQKMFPSVIKDVRGRGFMIGIELFDECSDFVKQMRERKVLINCTGNNVLRILPPLIAGKNEIDFFLYNFHEILKSFRKNGI